MALKMRKFQHSHPSLEHLHDDEMREIFTENLSSSRRVGILQTTWNRRALLRMAEKRKSAPQAGDRIPQITPRKDRSSRFCMNNNAPAAVKVSVSAAIT
jgi:hypothetical protein